MRSEASVAASEVASLRSLRSSERAGALALLAYAAAQTFQELVLRRAPAESDAAASHAFALSSLDRLRAVALFVAFLGLVVAYAAVVRRLRRNAWATAGAGFVGIFLVLELGLRAVELVAVADWQRAWLAPTADRTALDARLGAFAAVQGALYLPLLAAHALASLAFGVAATGRDRLERLARAAFVLNGARAGGRLAAMYLDIAALGPIADAAYLPVTLFHAVVLGVWLARRPTTAV